MPSRKKLRYDRILSVSWLILALHPGLSGSSAPDIPEAREGKRDQSHVCVGVSVALQVAYAGLDGSVMLGARPDHPEGAADIFLPGNGSEVGIWPIFKCHGDCPTNFVAIAFCEAPDSVGLSALAHALSLPLIGEAPDNGNMAAGCKVVNPNPATAAKENPRLSSLTALLNRG